MTGSCFHITHRFLLVAIVVCVLAPLIPLLIWSFSHRWYFPSILPTEWSARAWRYVLLPSSQVGKALGYSTVVGLSVTLLSILVGLPAGRALALYQFRGKSVRRCCRPLFAAGKHMVATR